MSLVERYREQHPAMRLSVHYVWLPMFPTPMEHAALPDAAGRVAHGSDVMQYWDGEGTVGKRLGTLALELGLTSLEDEIVQVSRGRYGGTFVAWDAYALFDPDATWGTAEHHLLGWGAPIVREKADLLARLEDLRGSQDEAAPTPSGTKG